MEQNIRRKYDEVAYALVETSDGGFAIFGCTAAFGDISGGDFLLVKTDEYGNMEWNKTYGGPSNNWAWALVETSDGGFAMAGFTSPHLQWVLRCFVGSDQTGVSASHCFYRFA